MVPEKKLFQSPGPQNLGQKLETVSLQKLGYRPALEDPVSLQKLGCRPALEDPEKQQGLSSRMEPLEALRPVELAVDEDKRE